MRDETAASPGRTIAMWQQRCFGRERGFIAMAVTDRRVFFLRRVKRKAALAFSRLHLLEVHVVYGKGKGNVKIAFVGKKNAHERGTQLKSLTKQFTRVPKK